jgi:hypothetical protein
MTVVVAWLGRRAEQGGPVEQPIVQRGGQRQHIRGTSAQTPATRLSADDLSRWKEYRRKHQVNIQKTYQ